MIKIIVAVTNENQKWFLKRTTWTSAIERADKFDSIVEAENAVEKAKKFMRKKIYADLVYEQIEVEK